MTLDSHSARRRLAVLALPLVLSLGLTGCGGDSDEPADGDSSSSPDDFGDVESAAEAPDDITVEEFCAPGDDPVPDPGLLSEDDPEAAAAAARDAARALIERGTPEGFSEQGREGFEVLADYFATITADELGSIADTADPDEIFGDAGTAVEAYLEEAVSVCVGAGPSEFPSGSPGVPSEVPSDFPTEGEQ